MKQYLVLGIFDDGGTSVSTLAVKTAQAFQFGKGPEKIGYRARNNLSTALQTAPHRIYSRKITQSRLKTEDFCRLLLWKISTQTLWPFEL